MTDSQSAKWLQAVVKKMNSQKARKFYHLVTSSSCQFILSGKWIFKLKKSSDDFIVRYKARWIAHDYRQMKNKNYDESYVLVVRFDNSRILPAIAARKRWLIKQFDVKIVYLYKKMDRDLYIEQSKNFIEGENLVYKLNSNLYKLIQSGHLWFKKFNSSLKIFELTQFKWNKAVFFDAGCQLYIILYVNDIKIFCLNEASISRLKNHLKNSYEMSTCDVIWYFKMKISRTVNEVILLTQRKCIRDLLQRHEMKNYVVVFISMMKTNLVKTSEDYQCQIDDLKIYQVLIENLMHLMI